MSEQMELKSLQREAHRIYNSDGVLDVSVGLALVLCAALIYAGLPWLAFAALAAGVSTYYALKRIITMPRTGYAKFKVLVGDRNILKASIIGFAALAVIVLTALLTKDTLLTLAAVAASVLALAGYVFYVERLYAYAAVILVVCVAGRTFGVENAAAAIMPEEVVHVMYLIVPGTLMMAVGALLLAFYAGKYGELKTGGPVTET